MPREDINSCKGEKREIKKCLADKGYYDANEMRRVMEMGIEPVVKKERMRKEGDNRTCCWNSKKGFRFHPIFLKRDRESQR